VYNIVSLSNCVDRAAPSVQITVPPDGSGQSGAFPVIINAVDDCSLDHIDLYVQDRGKFLLISSQKVYGTGGSIGYTLDTTQRPLMNVNPARPPLNGQHPLAAYAFDAVGNRSDYSLVTFFLRNTVTDPGNALFAIDAGHSNLNSFCQITSVKTDSAGRINVVGIFQGTTNFLGQSISSVGGVTDYDLFVAQISTSGTLNWLNHYGNALENRLAAVTVDSTDNVIVIGQSNGDINLGGSTLINPSTLGTSIIVAKYNSAGAHQWSIMHGGVLGGNNGNAVCVDSSNDVYIGGQFHFQADFGGGTRQGNGGESGFVAKYSGADGSYIWDHINLGNSFNSVSAVTTQGTQLFAVGYSFGDIDVGGGNMPALTEQGFAASYNKASGAFNWGRPHAGTGSNVQALGCVMDTTGHLLVTGSYTSGFSIDSISYTQSGISGSGAGYVVRLDTVAGLAIAGFQIGGTSSIGGVASGGPIAVDSAGNIIVGGIATGEVDFGDGQVTGGTGSMWVAKYTPGMLVTWYDRLGGTPNGSAIVKSMAVDGSRNIVLVGGVSGSFSLQGNTVTSVSQQNSDGFVIRYSP
jgi:hypothetical protein